MTEINTNKKIVIGMSGGVDSAVSALLLKQQGYDCVGVFMKNWDEQDSEGNCTAEEDYDYVRAVCDKIDIPYYTVNFVAEYKARVFDYFLQEYASGRTPNPDVMCNKEIKFAAFLDFAIKLGAEGLATGHYAQLEHRDGLTYLLRGADKGKDQTYFLHALSQTQLSPAIFPVGGMQKQQVREIATAYGLASADRKDSTGICFIGERDFREFLSQFLPAKRGEMRTLDGKFMGYHTGSMYYTLGQRHGLGIGGQNDGRPWFVVDKDIKNNILYVEQGEHERLFSNFSAATQLNFIQGTPPYREFDCTAKFRYRQPDQEVHVIIDNDQMIVEHKTPQRAVTPGQSIVLYDGEVCLGGGVIDKTWK